MIKVTVRILCSMLLLGLTVKGIAQSKPASKSKPAAAAKPVKPAEKKEEVEDEKPPEIEKLEETKITPTPALPPLPEIDTTAAPNDDLTKEIKKLLVITNSMNTAIVVMKGTIESQRQNPSIQLPAEFYDRFLQTIDNGLMGGMLENAIIKIYRQKFNQEEMREVIKFYESPIGKKMAAESASIANTSRIEGEKIGQYLALKIIDSMMKEGKWK